MAKWGSPSPAGPLALPDGTISAAASCCHRGARGGGAQPAKPRGSRATDFAPGSARPGWCLPRAAGPERQGGPGLGTWPWGQWWPEDVCCRRTPRPLVGAQTLPAPAPQAGVPRRGASSRPGLGPRERLACCRGRPGHGRRWPAEAPGACLWQLGGRRWLLSGAVPTALASEGWLPSAGRGALQATCPGQGPPAGSACRHSSPAGRPAPQMAQGPICARNAGLLFPGQPAAAWSHRSRGHPSALDSLPGLG